MVENKRSSVEDLYYEVESELELADINSSKKLNEEFAKKYTLQAFDGNDWITVTKDFELLAKNSKSNDGKTLDFDSWLDMKADSDFLDFVETAKENNWQLRLLNGKNNKETKRQLRDKHYSYLITYIITWS